MGGMHLPVMPPVKPMLAKPVADVPAPDSIAGGVVYEPKWDGFRCIVFRDGDDIELGSRNEKPLTRYFPEVVDAVLAQLPERCVVDGEIVVRTDDRLDIGKGADGRRAHQGIGIAKRHFEGAEGGRAGPMDETV